MVPLTDKVLTVSVPARQGWAIVAVLLRQLVRHPRTGIRFEVRAP